MQFPNPVMLSQKRPPNEIRIDHVEEDKNQIFYMPSDTYAYVANGGEPLIM